MQFNPIKIDIPDVSELAQSAIGFSPNPELERVTDAQREEDERIYREQLNAAKNLEDSIKVATGYVSAAIATTKLGQKLIDYRIGVQDINTKLIDLDRSVLRSAQSQLQYEEEQAVLNHSYSAHTIGNEVRANQINEYKTKAQLSSVKAQAAIHELNQAVAAMGQLEGS